MHYQETASEKLRKLSVCCKELEIVWISDGAIVACNYDLLVVSKSNGQYKPRL
jgi:hypothetical protein